MPQPTRSKTHVRCGTPDCDWGAPLSSLSDGQLDQFREHCIERHGLDLKDSERICWFDLEALTLTLLDDDLGAALLDHGRLMEAPTSEAGCPCRTTRIRCRTNQTAGKEIRSCNLGTPGVRRCVAFVVSAGC